MHGDIRDDWKISAIESDVNQVKSRMYELDSLRSNVDSLEHTNREISSTVDGLRHELEMLRQEVIELVDIVQGHIQRADDV